MESYRWVTLVLLADNGTPAEPGDDAETYFVSDQLVPDAGVPIDAPAGWTLGADNARTSAKGVLWGLPTPYHVHLAKFIG